MSLNFGDEKVTKLYYKDKDVSGSQMLEAGTILFFSGQNLNGYNSALNKPNATVSLVLPDCGVHWENVNDLSITVIHGSSNVKGSFNVNEIDQPVNCAGYSVSRIRGTNDNPDKLSINTGKNYTDLAVIKVS
ncbi:hypothetical protein [Companilactobacillus zhachilii]|uniref:hypothetical protein n=1 Tax=Companilactobacillus zhachilii TaxID=2304606 RepID=UPI004033E131